MAARQSRDTRVAIMSRSMNSPGWMPASKRPATAIQRAAGGRHVAHHIQLQPGTKLDSWT